MWLSKMAARPDEAAPRPAPQRVARFAAVSTLLLIPIFWHRRIEAGDLGSHLYNAWLVQLIQQGRAPGLWLARQWNNVLFDLLLSWFAAAFGLHAAERIAVSLAVLIFFWGSFALIAAATRRTPWNLAPLLAVVAYGWTFEMGFLNYYLSLGLCFFVLAAWLRAGSGLRLISLALVPLIWLAHPLGVACLAGIAAYALAVTLVPAGYRRYLLLAAGSSLIGVRVLLARHFSVLYNPLARHFFFNGADQLALFSRTYYVLYALFAVVCVVVLVFDVVRDRSREPGLPDARALPLQLYVLAAIAGLVLPATIYLPGYTEPLSFLTSRLTSVSAVLLCWTLAAAKPRVWHAWAYAALALVFFTFLYVDTGKLNRMEAQVEQTLEALPPGHRVVEHIDTGQEFRLVFEHMVDRACIGRCFSYSNYEPSGGQFRVRANPGNSIVTADPPNDLDDESEAALVKALDPPVYVIFWCDEKSLKFCTRELSAGELKDLVEGCFDPNPPLKKPPEQSF